MICGYDAILYIQHTGCGREIPQHTMLERAKGHGSVSGCMPYWIVVYSLSFICVLFLESYSCSRWLACVASSNVGASKKRKVIAVEVK